MTDEIREELRTINNRLFELRKETARHDLLSAGKITGAEAILDQLTDEG